MSDDNETVSQDELTVLKSRATMLGIKFHPSIGVEALREKVNAAVTGEPKTGDNLDSDPAPADPSDDPPAPAAVAPAAVPETAGQRRLRKKQEASKLVRINVTCMNPAKKEYAGEIFTCGNGVVGTFKKYVPFNSTEGWHVPHMIYQMIKDRMCPVFYTVNDERGNKVRKSKLIREFNIEVMPQLTADEIQELAQRQAMAKTFA